MWLVKFGVISLIVHTAVAGAFPNYHPEWEFYLREEQKDWWQIASFYQIYPRSFKDSNGDGIGDLNGITQQLPYLKEIGVNATWLSPIFKSPMADFGYDISDFRDIQTEYGTLDDLKTLVAEAHKLEIKLVLDFVPNHSSDEADWFLLSANKTPGWEDFYIWNSGKEDPNNPGKRLPPNNWLSVFRGSAWEWHEGRGEFYYHQFLAKQPDLNYRSQKVVDEMKNVIRFWLDFGIDGFRIDAVPHLFERIDLLDEPRNPSVNDPDNWSYLDHIYTVDQPETFDMIYQWRAVTDEYKKRNGGVSRVLLAEAYSPLDKIFKYYGNDTAKGAHLPFNFFFITRLNNQSTAYDYDSAIHDWVDNMPKDATANWVVGNHDQRRVGSRLGANRIDLMNTLVLALPGAAVTYQGEEIGMTDVFISWNDTVDPAACNSNPDIYQEFTRDPERTPFQWNDKKSAGFSTNASTWLPISPDYKLVNVEKESKQLGSHLEVYKQIKELRNHKTLQYGTLKTEVYSSQILKFTRSLPGEKTFFFIMNVSGEPTKVDLTDLKWNKDKLRFVMATKQAERIRSFLTSDKLEILDYEVLIFSTIEKSSHLSTFLYDIVN